MLFNGEKWKKNQQKKIRQNKKNKALDIEFNTSSDDSGVLMANDSFSSDSLGKFNNEEEDDGNATVKRVAANKNCPTKQVNLESALCNGAFSCFSQKPFCSHKLYYSDTSLYRKSSENCSLKLLYFSDTFLNLSKEEGAAMTLNDYTKRNVERIVITPQDSSRKTKISKKNTTEGMNNKSRRNKLQTKSFHLNYSNNLSTLQRNSNSLNKRLSSSHNSLSDSNKADDSIFIKQVLSLDTLNDLPIDNQPNLPVCVVAEDIRKRRFRKSENFIEKSWMITDAVNDYKILDFYNVPLDSDIYATPVDFIRNKHTTDEEYNDASSKNKCHHHMIQSTSSYAECKKNDNDIGYVNKSSVKNVKSLIATPSIKKKAAKDSKKKNDRKSTFSITLKQKICNIFRISQHHKHYRCSKKVSSNNMDDINVTNFVESHPYSNVNQMKSEFTMRKLPSLPDLEATLVDDNVPNRNLKKTCVITTSSNMDFASNIEKVKEFGWYWGNTSSEGAEKILSNEPDGSFLVRDSSDSHYIFSLTFKLNGTVRHVRIDHDQGSFSFGSCAKFKSRTIMEFIENAVEHSRSGRYLFFLHRRPEYGPIRVQLTNPVSRFKHIQSLQHMCRFIIHKTVIRKDLIETLPLPRRILDYLCCQNCFEHVIKAPNL